MRLQVAVAFIAMTAALSSVYGAVLTATADTDKLSVGDRIQFTVSATIAKGATLTPPDPDSDFGAIVVKEWNLEKTERESFDSCVYKYIVTTYTPEPCTIPELRFVLENSGPTDTLKTQPLPLHILSVIPGDTVDIMDLKSQFSAGSAPKWWIWVIGTALALALVIFGAGWLMRRLKKTAPPPPPQPPYEEAIDALANLGTKKYLQRGLIREYVFELSEIFKRYIGRHFSCNGVEFTTEEMIAWSAAADLPKKLRTLIEQFFRTIDPIKFARLIPDSATIEGLEPRVREFLEATRPQPLPDNTAGDTADRAAQKQPDTGANKTQSQITGEQVQ